MDLTAIREGLAAAVDTVAGIRVFSYPVDQVPTGNVPVVVVSTPTSVHVDYNEAFIKGLAVIQYTLQLYVQYVAPEYALAVIEDMCSSGTGQAKSIVDAVMDGDRTLGGVCSDLIFDRVLNIGVVTNTDGIRYLNAEIDVRVLAART